MSILYQIRHGDKAGTRVDPAKRVDCFRLGQRLKDVHPGKEIYVNASDTESESCYPGRAVETGELVLAGAAAPYERRVNVDERLRSSFSDAQKAVIKGKVKEEGKNLFEAALEAAPETMYELGIASAASIDQYLAQHKDGVTVNITHSPCGVENLVYLLTGNYDLANGDPACLEGFKVEYNEENGIYVVTMDFGSKEQVIVADVNSLKEKVEQTIEDLVESGASDEGSDEASDGASDEEGSEAAEAAE